MKKKTKKLVILTGYFTGESYGLLGPQMAATIINNHTDHEVIVVGLTNEDTQKDLKTALSRFFKDPPKLIEFSYLERRPDLFEAARDLKNKGAVTFLAGPQAGPDYKGEIGWQTHSQRFKGLSDHFSKDKNNQIIETPSLPWEDDWLSSVDWQTLHILKDAAFKPLAITTAQVLQQIGCPHAAKERQICIDSPAGLQKDISPATVKAQLSCLPSGPDGRKIPFKLINENPLFTLSQIFSLAEEVSIELSQINLTLRADYLLKGLKSLETALGLAKKKNMRILLSSIGFESFDDTILKNLNKGVSRQANHGFIHPTPWDTKEISYGINKTIGWWQTKEKSLL